MFRDEKYVRSNVELNVPAHLNYGQFLLDRFRSHKDGIALINGMTNDTLTFAQLTQYAVNVASALVDLGASVGDVIAICSERRNDFIPLIVGAVLTGATYTPFDPKIGRVDLKHKLNLVKPKYLITTGEFWNQYSDIIKSFEYATIIMVDDNQVKGTVSLKSLMSKNVNVNHFQAAKVRGQKDIALILYSSGSTGMPKGVLLSHLTSLIKANIGTFGNPSYKTMLCYAEWSHSYDNHMTFQFLAAGKTVVYFEGSAESFLHCVQAHKVNLAFTYPSLIYELAECEAMGNYNLDSLQFIYSGTSALDMKIRDKFLSRLPKLDYFVQGYGMTETFELTSERWGEPGLKKNTVGKPAPGVTLKVVDTNTGELLGPHQKGEICVEAHNRMNGYIGIDPSTYLDKEGFLKTGDLAYYDEDGYFYIIDRIKEIISYNGYKISPVELELVLLQHPAVKDVGVVGKPVPDYGEEPTAFVSTNPECSVTEKELMDYVAYEVAPYMQIRGGVKFVESIPRNNIGKIKRPALKEMLRQLEASSH